MIDSRPKNSKYKSILDAINKNDFINLSKNLVDTDLYTTIINYTDSDILKKLLMTSSFILKK